MYVVLPIIPGTLKAMNFKFGRNIRRLTPSKGRKNFGDKGAWAYPGTAQFFCVLYPLITPGTLKAMNFKFGRNIRRLNPSKTPLKILDTRGRGRSHGLSKIFRAATYRAHRAVVFAIAQLSCFP